MMRHGVYHKRAIILAVFLIAIVGIRLVGLWNGARRIEEPVGVVPHPFVEELVPEWHPSDPTLPFDFGPRKHDVPMVFSPDGHFIACGYGGWDHNDVVEIWDLKTGAKELLEPRFPGKLEAVYQVEYNKDGNLLAVNYNGQAISIFHVKTKEMLSTYVCQNPGYVDSLRFTEENRLRFFESPPERRLQNSKSDPAKRSLMISELDPASGKRKVVYVLPAEADSMGIIAPGGGYATVSNIDETFVVDIEQKTKLFGFVRWAVTEYIPGRQQMIAQHGRELQLLSLPSGRVLKRLDLGEHVTDPARCMAVSSSGAMAALSNIDGYSNVRLVDLEKMREIRKIKIGPDESMPGVVTFSSDEKYLLTSTHSISVRDKHIDPVICIWKLE